MGIVAFAPAATTATGSTTAITYLHQDHLNSTNATTDGSGLLAENLQYYPYGAIRTDTLYNGSGGNQRKYIGEVYDASSGLDYLNARYYASGRGGFVSEDPVFLGNPKQQDLSNPQSFNPYSYSLNNPISRSDPSGNLSTASIEPAASSFFSDAIKQAESATGFFYGIFNDPSGTSLNISSWGTAASRQLSLALTNPGGSAQSLYNSTANQWRSFWNSSDQQQGKTLGSVAAFGAGFLVPGGAEESLGFTAENSLKDIVKGFNHNGTYHGLDRIIDRGVTPAMIKDAVMNPVVKVPQFEGRTLYLSNQAAVVLDRAGQVVTAWTKNEFNANTHNLLNLTSGK
jgi:RHS repeat-associated protein